MTPCLTHTLSIFRLLRVLSKGTLQPRVKASPGKLKEAAWRGRKNKGNFFENCLFRPLKVKISKKLMKYMQKFSQFYVTYRNIVQFDHNLGKLDYFEKSVLKLMAGPVDICIKLYIHIYILYR